MLRQIGTLTIDTCCDWDNTTVKALEDAGLRVILVDKCITTEEYIIAREQDADKKEN